MSAGSEQEVPEACPDQGQKINTTRLRIEQKPLFSIFIYSQPLSNLTRPRWLPIPKCGLGHRQRMKVASYLLPLLVPALCSGFSWPH